MKESVRQIHILLQNERNYIQGEISNVKRLSSKGEKAGTLILLELAEGLNLRYYAKCRKVGS
jgi:hypothetical protein